MRNALSIVAVLLFAAAAATATVPPLPRTLANARYVYVTAYDGDQFNPNLLPDDRQAISAVQDAIQKSGKFILVYQPDQTDIVLMVQAAHRKTFWRCMTGTVLAANTCGG